jgi:hypothetical protein
MFMPVDRPGAKVAPDIAPRGHRQMDSAVFEVGRITEAGMASADHLKLGLIACHSIPSSTSVHAKKNPAPNGARGFRFKSLITQHYTARYSISRE